MQGGRCRQWILRPPAGLLLALPAAARSCAIGALLVAQPLLDGVLVLAACDERAPGGSGRVAVVSFSRVIMSLLLSTLGTSAGHYTPSRVCRTHVLATWNRGSRM